MNGDGNDASKWLWADKFVDDRKKPAVCAICGKSIQEEDLNRGIVVHRTSEENGTVFGKKTVHFADLCPECKRQVAEKFENWTERVLRADPYWTFGELKILRLHTAERLYYAQELVEMAKARGDYSLKGLSK